MASRGVRLPASSRVSSSPKIWAGLPRLIAHEVFVGEVGVELHTAQLGLLGVVADQGLGQAAGQPGFAGAGRPLEGQAQLVGQVAPGAPIKTEERPRAAPVQPEAEVPGHAVELHRRIKGGPKGPLGLLVFRVGQLEAEGKHLPELVDVVGC